MENYDGLLWRVRERERARQAEKEFCYHEDDYIAGPLCPAEGGLAGLAHSVKCSQGYVG